MQLNNEQKDKLGDLVLSPDWPMMVEFIESHFETSTSVDNIDTDNSPETVAAEVISAQKINKNLESLRSSFQTIRQQKNQSKASFK